jgi:acetolactate synthase I/II/III large subunit
VLDQVLGVVEARADDRYRKSVADRMASWGPARDTAAKRRAAASANNGVSGALSPAYLFSVLNRKLSPYDIHGWEVRLTGTWGHFELT